MLDTFLPIVKPEVGGSLQIEMLRTSDDDQYLNDQLTRLDEENPVISHFIKEFAKKHESEESMWAAIVVYRLLESQAAANRLENEIG